MSLNLKDLVASGAFISAAEPFVKREIEWLNTEGVAQKADVFVRLASYHTVTNTWKAAEGNQEHLAARVATMVCDAEGAPIFSTADLLGTADPARGPICDTLFLALISAVNEANSGKKSPQKTSGSK
jgi:Phage tail assembly chaperone, TAC